MTLQKDVLGNPDYIPVLDYGFVGLVDHMGSDASIIRAARTSYGKGTTSSRPDRELTRYLMRHRHTTPFEMAELLFHIRCPIFVVRQWVRHRTHSMNEYSARYSVMSDEMYLPDLEQIKPQSQSNKQGRAGELSIEDRLEVQTLLKADYTEAFGLYEDLLAKVDPDENPKTRATRPFSEDFYQKNGISREIARIVLPLATYTEFYWKQNLHNAFHLLGLRQDSHAQWEIQQFANAMYDLIQPWFPISCEAYVDYKRDAYTLSRMDRVIIGDLLSGRITWPQFLQSATDDPKALCARYEISKRELDEFIAAMSKTA